MGIIRKNLVLAVLITAVSGCGDSSTVTGPSPPVTNPPPAGVQIRGRLADFLTGTGVPDRVVEFQGGGSVTTGADGSYTITLSAAGTFSLYLDGTFTGTARVTGSSYRGELLVDDTRKCISRYGTLADAQTLQPVAGATVTLGARTAVSGPDGWYRIDLGCPETNWNYNTTFLYVSHPEYAPRSQVVGRGVFYVNRLDLDLNPLEKGSGHIPDEACRW